MTNLRYSEAIRLGGALSAGQCTYLLRNARDETCANGGAYLAAGMEPLKPGEDGFAVADGETVYRLWPWTDCEVTEPSTGTTGLLGGWVVPTLNNKYGWSRERIADFVETEERKRGFWKQAPAGAVLDRGEEEPVMEMVRRG